METIIRKVLNSTDSIIPLLKDQQNGFLVYFVVKEKSKIRMYVKLNSCVVMFSLYFWIKVMPDGLYI